MRFSVKSHSKLYFLLIFAITFYFLGDFAPFSSVDQHRIDLIAVYGQLDDDDENEKQGLNPNTTINAAIDGNNNGIANNGSTTSNTMKFSFSGRDGQGANIYRFECSMDGKLFVTCVSTNTVNVGRGTHTFSVRSEDNAGNKDSTPSSFTWTVNSETSNTQIDFATDGNKAAIVNGSNTSSNSMTFAFSGTDNHGAAIYRFECSMDRGAFGSCVSTNTVNVGDGTHTFSVRSEDNAGNKDSTPASFTWTVDTTPPMTSIISAIDGNNNTISDNGNSESTSIRFNFSGTDTGGAGVDHLECNIDNSKYVACTSPFVFPNLLKDGIHTFTVTSEDNAGNKDSTPASFRWTVDTTPPMTSIISAIDGNNNTISDNGNSESTSIRFNFSGTDTGGAGVDHLECNIDNSKYVACTSPFVFLNILKDGIHTFNVRSIDRVGNINLSPASFTWTIDTISPNTTLESATDGNKIVMVNGTNTNSKSMSFEFSANDTGGDGDKGVGINHFVCNIDNSKYVACTSPFVFPNLLKDGIHTFTVTSEDNAGNKDSTPTSFSWIVDTSSPLISINTATDGNGNLLSNDGNTSSNSATISFTGNDTGGKEGKGVGIKEFKCSLDGASFSICTSPVQFTSVNLPEGTHSFQIIAEDGIGNINSSPQSFNWTVDTEPPDITVDSATDGYQKHVTSGGNSSSDSIIFEFTALDNGGREGKGVGTKQFECKINNSDFVSCTSPVEFTNLSNGVHTLDLLSEDNVGNISPTPESFNWTVDTVSPTTTINKAIVGTESSLTNGSNSRFNSITFTFTGNDTDGLGIREFECSLDDSNFTTCTSPLHFNDTIITDGPHDFKVFSKDNVGNNDLSPELFTWNVDTIPPTTNITKAMDGNIITITNSSNTKSNSVIFEFSGNDTGGVGVDHFDCSLDGATFTTCTSPVQFSSADILDGTHAFSVRAQDKVGNIMSTPLLFNWTVDTVAPSTNINMAIDGNNETLVSNGSTRSTSTTFTFSGSDSGPTGENGVGIKQFECRVDNSNFSVCTSPAHYDNITDGNHTLAVISEDKVGNVGSMSSSFNWTVDTEPPSASIYSATDGSNNFLVPGSNTSSNSISFEFSANDTGGREDKGVGIKQFECSIDNSNFTTCSSPVEFASDTLADGSHIFKIGAEDNVGNMNPAPASFSWNIDTVTPTTIINNVMDGNRSTITNGSNTRSSSVIFEFAGNDTGIGISHFECSIDNSNFTSCTSPVQSNNLAEGYHSVKIRSQDGVGNTDDSPESFGWTVDTIAPLTSINSVIDGNSSEILTGGNTSSNTVRVEFSGTDSGVGVNHFECSLDNSEFAACTSPLHIDNLTDGIHILETRAHDNVGNKDVSSASFSWTVDTVPPTTSIVSVSNGNKSAISNNGNTSSNSATFSFSATDEGGVENEGVGISNFDCSIDNSNIIACTSPLEFNSLREGIHTLKIFSKDNVGKTSSPASFSWAVDTIPPFSTINSATDGNNKTLDNNDNSSSTSIKFAFTGNDSGGVGVGQLECSLDGGPFVSCASPIQYSSENISDGAHILEVRAKDRVGNISPTSSFTWTVDTVPPDANIESATDGNGTIIGTGGNTSSNSMLFNFSGIDTGGKEGNGVGINHFECSLDNSNFSACIGPVRASNLADGTHILEVRAEDNVGNISPSPSSFTWTVDTTAPTTAISSAIDDLQKAITNGGNSKSMSMKLGFTGNDTGVGVNHFECRIDNSNFTSCTSPIQSGNLTDGDHVFEVRAGDNVGNIGLSPSSFTWTVDTTPPATTIDSAMDGNNQGVMMDGNSSSNSILLEFAGTDTGTGINHFECSINNSDFVTCTSPLEVNGLTDGVHTLRVVSEDNSTNKDSSPALFRWTVDTNPPITSINSAVDINRTSIANGESTKSTSMIFAFSGTDAGGVQIDHFECSIDNSNFATCTTPVEFSNLKDGVHILQLRSEDKVGNVGSSSSYTWTVDTTPPATSVNSATDGNKSAVTNDGTTKSTSMTFTFSGTDTGGVDHFECSLDNSNFTICISPILFNSVNLKDGIHTFEVLSEDNSTNKDPSPASFTWTVDTQPPSTTIISAIDGNRTELRTGSNTSSNSMTFAFSANDTGGQEGKGVGINHFECNIDNSKFVTCTSPFTFQKLLNDGNYTFNVLSVDNSRNKDASPSSFTWTVDTTPPETSIKTATDGNKSAVTNDGTTKSASMTFTFSGNDTGGVGIDHFECNVDGLNFVACTSPFTFPSLSEDGQYTLEIRAQDRVGNKDMSPASFTWTVDTLPPETSFDSATDGNNRVISAGENTSSNSMIFLFSSSDSGVGVDHSECSIDNSDYALCTSPMQVTSTNLGDGTHTLQIRAEDKVGNKVSSPTSFNWTTDTVPSTAKIDSAVDGNKSAVANDGSTKSTTMTFTFSGNDTGGVGIDHFECSIDNSDFVTCTSPFTSPSQLKDGAHTFRILSEDNVGNKVSSPTSFNWTTDTVPSTAKIDSAVDGNKSAVANDGSTKSTTMTFTFSGNDTGGVGIDHFECSIDNSDFATCTSPFTSPSQLKDGAHTFRILSEDNVGNRGSSPDSFSWIVDTVSPSTTIDSVKDGNNNSVNTGGNSSSNSVIVSFSGIDTGGDQDKGVGINHFECSVDGVAFTNCSAPMKLDKLADGSHTLEIRSSDNVGNYDASPASFIWTIDTVPPNTSFSSVIDGNRNAVAEDGNTSSTSMTFAFSGTDTGSGLSLFECSLDGAPFATCESPININNLADGSHIFSVRSEDNVANLDQSPASFTWIIDTSPPTTSIDSVVDSNKNSLSNSSSTRSNSITFTFSGNDTGKAEVKRFECSTDNSDFVACTSPFGFPNLLSDGSHTFKVRAEDNSGNKDASAEIFSWNVDTTPPPANINSVFDGNNNTVSNGGNTTSTSISFTFSGIDIGVGLDHFECSIDEASFTICASPVQFNSLSDGSHTLEVRAADKVGNEGPTPTAFIWTVNTKPPNTSINSVTDGNKNIVANNSNTRSNTITILFSASEVVSNVDHFECSIDNSDFATCTSPFTFRELLKDGTHTFKARAEDNSGHEDMSPALYSWTVDTGAPTATITSATDSNNKTISAGAGTQSTSMIFTFTGTDAGVGLDRFECSVDGATFAVCTSPAQFDNLGSGAHTLNVKTVDNVGNEATSPASFNWSVDATPPDTTINSATDGNAIAVSNGGNTTSTSMTFTFSGTDIGVGLDHFECSLDGSTFSSCASPLQLNSLSLGAHTMEVRAEDKIGNEGETPTVFLWTIASPPPTPPPAQVPIPQNITTPPPAQVPIPQNITTPTQTAPPVSGNQSTISNTTAETSTSVQQPDTRIISAVDGNGTAVANDGVTPSNSILFVLSSSTGSIQQGRAFNNFECSIDGSAFTDCTSPAQFSNLADGAHILEARSTDNSGNEDQSPASFTWTVDTVPPDTIISAASDGNNNTISNGSNTESTSIELTVSGTDTSIEEDEEVGIHFECSLDGSSFSTCTSPVQYDNLGVGNHVVEIIAQDNSGNKDLSPASFTWNVNPVQQGTTVTNTTITTPMTTNIGETMINSITDGSNNAITNETTTPSITIRFEFSSVNVENLDHFECSMDGSDFVTCTSPFIFPILPEGKHVFMVRFVDLDGNMDESPATFVWDITG